VVVRHREREKEEESGKKRGEWDKVSFIVCVSLFGVGEWGMNGGRMNWCVYQEG
jgi:hypothetical protein